MLTGVPDGMGAYLLDASTIRVIFQSESYGPMYWETYPFAVASTGATFTGSHVQYVDYDRTLLADFMTHGDSAYSMVKGSGNTSIFLILSQELNGAMRPSTSSRTLTLSSGSQS